MKLSHVERHLKAVALIAAIAGLAFVTISCRKQADESAQGNGSGDNSSMTGKNMSMPGMNTSTGKNQSMSGMNTATGMNHSRPGMNRPMPAASEGVIGRRPVDLDQQARQLINIRTQPVTRGEAVVAIRTVGIVAYDQTKLVNVNTRIMGWAEKLYVDKPGQSVKRGDPLLDIYSPDLYSAQYEYLLAYRQWQKFENAPRRDDSQTNNAAWQQSANEAQALMESARKRLKLWEISNNAITALEKSGKPRDTLQLHTPFSGYVIQKNIDPAAMVRPGMTLYRVANLNTVWINADIYEYELPYVKVGQKVTVTALANPGRVFDAKVNFIYPYSENKTRTTTVRLVMENEKGRFKPDNYVNAEIKQNVGQRLLVPDTAVFDTGPRQFVFVEVTDGHFVPRRIELGPRVGNQFVVNTGLAEGEQVVVDGNFLLDSESQLRAAGSGDGQQ
jgi:membrane fusion protein, copper/silver efflux system